MGTALGEDCERQRDDRDDLQDQQHAENLCADIDVAIADDADDRDEYERPHPPWQIWTAGLGHQGSNGVGSQAVDPGLHGGVGEHGQTCRADAEIAAKPLRDICVKGACVCDRTAHRGVANAEHQQHQCGDYVGQRCARTVAERDHHRQ